MRGGHLCSDMVRTATVTAAREDPVVLVVADDHERAALYADWLGSRWPIRVAHDEAAAVEALGDPVSVALVDRDLGDGAAGAVLSAVRRRGLDCRVAAVTGVVPDADVVELAVDDYLVKPVEPDELRGTVSELLLRSRYDEHVREYFALACKRALLEAEYDSATLEAREEYAELCDRLATARETLDGVFDELADRGAFEGLCRELADSSAPV